MAKIRPHTKYDKNCVHPFGEMHDIQTIDNTFQKPYLRNYISVKT